jgi:large subunit ribosomal protein L30
MSEKVLSVKQVKSAIGRAKTHQACLKGLGIRRMHQAVQVRVTPENLGMINKVNYMLKVEEI